MEVAYHRKNTLDRIVFSVFKGAIIELIPKLFILPTTDRLEEDKFSF